MASVAKLVVTRVKCRDELGPWPELGNDEMFFGAIGVNNDGATFDGPRILAGGNMDDGEQRIFEPPQLVVTVPLSPRFVEQQVGALLVLYDDQEQEGDRTLRRIYDEARPRLKAEYERVSRSDGGATVLIAILTAILVPIAQEVGAWAKDQFSRHFLKDKVMPPTALIASVSSSMAAGTVVVAESANFEGFGGKYLIDYQWIVE